MALFKNVNGKRIELSEEEEAAFILDRKRSQEKYEERELKEKEMTEKKKMLVEKLAKQISTNEQLEDTKEILESMFNL